MINYGLFHVACTLRMLRGDDSALDDMDISADGFWRSFGAIVLSLPPLIFVWVHDSHDLISFDVPGTLSGLVFLHAIADLVLWILPVVVMLPILRLLGFGHRFVHFVITTNWLSLFLNYLAVGVLFIEYAMSSVTGNESTAVWSYLLLVAFLLFSLTQITRVALGSGHLMAIGLVLFQFIGALMAFFWLYDVLGLLPPSSTPS